MSKVAVVYYSGTGNTQAMAEAVAAGVQNAGGEAELISCEEFDVTSADAYDALAFGCPAMGAEELEETVFEPMFSAVEGFLAGKNVGLFGSFGWGDGTWMHNWEDRVRGDGAVLVADGVMANGAPDATAEVECAALGAALA